MIVPAHSYLGSSSTSVEALECLRRDIISGDTVCQEESRLLVWQALLLSLPDQPFTRQVVNVARKRAQEKQEEHRTREPGGEFDPLSNSDSWNSFYNDQDLRAVILQDCERVFPEEEWFKKSQTQRILQDCLFTWCKDNPDVSYKQGMHELAAIMTWVSLHAQHETPEQCYHDTYGLFAAVMKHVKKFYIVPDKTVSPILEHSSRIQKQLLSSVDPVLATRLAHLEIEPQLYCMRWLRLLFIREYAFQDVLRLWDGLFAADPTLEIVDWIACAMLIRVRSILLESDNSGSLMTLMRYPAPATSIISCVQESLQLRDRSASNGSKAAAVQVNNSNAAADPLSSLNHIPTTALYTMGQLLEQTDKLGINHYVKGAVEEVKRNVTPIISETRQALARTHSRDPSLATSPTKNTIIGANTRDRELASVLALVISNLKNGDPLEDNIRRLEDIKFVLQGRKQISDLAASHVTLSREENRPSTAPEPARSVGNGRRTVSPIRIPAIRSKDIRKQDSLSDRLLSTDTTLSAFEHKDDIPLSVSPKRSSQMKNSNFSFLFAEDEPHGSTFNRPRK